MIALWLAMVGGEIPPTLPYDHVPPRQERTAPPSMDLRCVRLCAERHGNLVEQCVRDCDRNSEDYKPGEYDRQYGK